ATGRALDQRREGDAHGRLHDRQTARQIRAGRRRRALAHPHVRASGPGAHVRGGRLHRRARLRRLQRRPEAARGPARAGGARVSGARRRVAVVVDAYSTGARLAPRFRAAGLDVVHVQSNANESPFYIERLRREDFVANVVHGGDLEATADQVAAYDPAFVVVGSEPGVLLSDALSERLGLPSNGTALSRARRDKHEMANALRRARLRAVAEHKTGDPEAAVAWASERGEWPVVVKPLDSAGTDGVSLCETPDAIRGAFAELLGRPNALQGANEQLLVQELLRGVQLFTDSISWDGVHHVSEVWRDTKRRIEGNLAYDFEELLDARGEQQDQVVPYVHAVLDA